MLMVVSIMFIGLPKLMGGLGVGFAGPAFLWYEENVMVGQNLSVFLASLG